MEKVISIFGMKLPVKANPSSAWPPDAQGSGGDGPARYRYDDSNRLTEVLYSGGVSQVFDYDRHDNLRQRKTANGRSLSYGYDEDRRLRTVAGDRGERVTFDYGARTQRFASAACTTEMDLDQDKRPVRVRQIVDGVTFRTDYDYDAAGRCVGIRPPGSLQWLRYDHDQTNDTLQIRAGNGHCYVTLRSGEVQFANGVCQRQRLDSEGRIEQMVATASGGGSVMDLCYRFNERWQITQINERRFTYDAEGQLTACVDGALGHARYTHDASGNRVTEQSGTGATSYLYDERGRLLQMTRSDGSRTDYRYDADGNRIARDDGRCRSEYRYDGEGRLTAVWADGMCAAEYAYDALGRRIKKKIGATVTLFHHDENGQLIAETDECGRARATYLWAGMRCLGRIEGAVGDAPAEFYHNDHLGSVLAVTAESGDIVSTYDGDVFGRHAGPFFARKIRDAETGFYDFGARFYDPESGRFLTPDSYTGGPDDWRELFDPKRDFWGERQPRSHFVQQRPQHPHASNPYSFCVNDPVNHIDLDGHNAWWFFLTIPSSLTWALPNTAFALLIVIGNILMEIIGWVVWVVICLINKEFALKHYPWGNRTPRNPFDPDDRSHLWFGLEASKRLGVPWVLLNGSFFVWRPYTMGNIIFIDDPDDNGLKADALSRYVVPKDPDLQLSAQDALHNHEMQHVFQYACLGSLFHSLPIPPLVRLITGKIEHGELTDRDRWWERIDLGGVTWAVGSLIQLLSFKLIKAKDVQRWVNPATWWSAVLPFKWVELVSNAWNLDNWLPFVGVYEWDSKFFFDQNHSSLERNSGANSGDVYQTVVEAGKTEIRIGEFVRVVGADAVPHATPAGPSVSSVSFGIDPPVTNVGPAAASLNPSGLPHRINFDVVNTFPVRVVNASGFYFHSLEAGTFKVKGTGSQTAATETVSIKVSDIKVKIETDTFVCQDQDIEVTGDSNAAYTVRVKTSNSGGAIVAGTRTYTAGPTPGTDTIEVVANYDAAKGVFKKYGDNGLAGHDYVLKAIDINVKDPTITPDVVEVFVGGIVNFTIDHQPQSGTTTTAVPGSQFNLEKKQFIAGKGPIAADTVETVTFDYACKTFPVNITVHPIVATVTANAVDGGGTAQVNVSGGIAPFKFAVSEAQSTGPTVDGNGLYTAGSGTAPTTDTITVTDRNGDGGRARVQVSVNPMTVSASPAAVGVSGTSTVTALSGVAPFTFSITSRESAGSTINNNGEYRAGTTPGSDTITVTDRKGTRLTVTITVT